MNTLHHARLGNDIVDFSVLEAQYKYLDKRFLARVFCPSEIKSIHGAQNKNQFLWAVWAAKEAAYKACQKNNIDLVFSPVKFTLSEESLEILASANDKAKSPGSVIYGVICHADLQLCLRWDFPGEYCVHCCAVLSGCNITADFWKEVHYRAKKVFGSNSVVSYTDRSFQVRKLLIALLTETNSEHALTAESSTNPFEISRPLVATKSGVMRQSFPILSSDKKKLDNYEISLSHDFHWVAAAYLGAIAG